MKNPVDADGRVITLFPAIKNLIVNTSLVTVNVFFSSWHREGYTSVA